VKSKPETGLASIKRLLYADGLEHRKEYDRTHYEYDTGSHGGTATVARPEATIHLRIRPACYARSKE
jgi:uncharacterized membrane protein